MCWAVFLLMSLRDVKVYKAIPNMFNSKTLIAIKNGPPENTGRAVLHYAAKCFGLTMGKFSAFLETPVF